MSLDIPEKLLYDALNNFNSLVPEKYKLSDKSLNLLHSGNYSNVYGVMGITTGEEYILKVMASSHTYIGGQKYNAENIITMAYNEIIAMRWCQKNKIKAAKLLTQYEYIYRETKNDFGYIFFFLMPKYSPLGEILKFKEENNGEITENDYIEIIEKILIIFKDFHRLQKNDKPTDISSVVKELEESNVLSLLKDYNMSALFKQSPETKIRLVHKDVKPSNFFCDIFEDGTYDILLGDFGSTWLVNESGSSINPNQINTYTPDYEPPSIAQKTNPNVGPYVDIFSLGRTINNLLLPENFEEILKISPKPNISDGFSEILENMQVDHPYNKYSDASAVIEDLNRLKTTLTKPKILDELTSAIAQIKIAIQNKDERCINDLCEKYKNRSDNDVFKRIYAWNTLSRIKNHSAPMFDFDELYKIIEPLAYQKNDPKAKIILASIIMIRNSKLSVEEKQQCGSLFKEAAELDNTWGMYLYARFGYRHSDYFTPNNSPNLKTIANMLKKACYRNYTPAIIYSLKYLQTKGTRLHDYYSDSERSKLIADLKNMLRQINDDPDVRNFELLI